MQFYRSLIEASHAGISVVLAVEAASSSGALAPEVSLNLRARLRRGESLAASMAQFPEAFPAWQTAIVAMGETTGRMDLAFSLISDILEKRRSFWLGMLARLAAPLLLLHLGPIILQTPLWASGGFAVYSSAVLKALARLYILLLGLVFAWPWLKDSAFMSRFWRFDSKHRFCACLTALIQGGVSLNQAVEISCLAADRPAPPAGWEKRETVVERLTQLRLFAPEELSLLQVAEFSGKVDDTLAHIARQARDSWQTLRPPRF